MIPYWEGELPGKPTALYSMKFFILALFLAILTILDPYPLVSVFRIRNIWYGSGSSDLYPWLTDQTPGLAPNPVLLTVTFKLFFFSLFFSLLLLHHSSQIKRSHKTVEIKGFLTIFCLMMGGSRSVPLSNGPGFGSGTLIGTTPNFCRQVPAVPVPYYSIRATGLWNIKSLGLTSTYRYVFKQEVNNNFCLGLMWSI